MENSRAGTGSTHKPTWKEFVRELVQTHCNEACSRTFGLKEFADRYLNDLRTKFPENHHPREKLRQTLQKLRDEKLLIFEDNHGSYTLARPDPFPNEIENRKEITRLLAALDCHPEKREYVFETFVRNPLWARKAKEAFGEACMLIGCTLAFKKEDGNQYVEVHHIKPLHEGGTDGVWNLSILCAHHHRMAHFAVASERRKMRQFLELQNEQIRTGRP